jgi:hypothetical protein
MAPITEFRRSRETRVFIINQVTAEKEYAGTIVYDEPSDSWAFAYARSFEDSIDPINMPNKNGRIYPFTGENPPGVFADLLPGQFVEEKLSRMIRGYKDMHTMDRLQAIGSRVHKGIGLEVGGNPAYGIDPRPNQLADFDKSLARFGLRDFFDHEEIGLFVRGSKDWGDYLHELKKSYSGQQPLFNVLGVNDEPYLLKLYNSASVLNRSRLEFVAQKTALAAGARIPDIRMIRMKELQTDALLIQRFDTTKAISLAAEDTGIGKAEIKNVQLRSLTIAGLQGSKSIYGMHYNEIARSLEKLDGAAPGQPQSSKLIKNKTDLFRQSLLNHAFNNIDNHAKNMSVVFRDGEWEMSPAYDMGFFSHEDSMPITFYGEPPIHSADILADDFIRTAWSAMNMPDGAGDPFAIRDQVVSAVVNDLPKEMVSAGIGLTKDGKITSEAKHIAKAIGVQSEELGLAFRSSLKSELQNHLVKTLANEKAAEKSQSAPSMER